MSLTKLTASRLSLKRVSPISLMEKQLITMMAPEAVFQSMMTVRIKVAETAAANYLAAKYAA
jgi:hypothetical protein